MQGQQQARGHLKGLRDLGKSVCLSEPKAVQKLLSWMTFIPRGTSGTRLAPGLLSDTLKRSCHVTPLPRALLGAPGATLLDS